MSLVLALAAAKTIKRSLQRRRTSQQPTPADSVVTTKTKAGITGYSKERTVTYPSKGAGGGMKLPAGMHCAPTSVDGRFRATRLNKSTYVTRGGGTSRWPGQLIVHEKGTECVTVRRRHVTNAKALRRAISRLRGFVKTYRKAAHLLGVGRRSRSGCRKCGSNPCRCK